MEQVKLGVSKCLLGERVRYDGEHSLEPLLTGPWSDVVAWVPVCPEAELGLGIPRETIRLVREGEEVRLRYSHTKGDLTDAMLAWCEGRAKELAELELDGYVFKSRSPSCGTARVKCYRSETRFELDGVGLFARVFSARFPLTPRVEETALQTEEGRDGFAMRVMLGREWRQLAAESEERTQAFLERHQLLLASLSSDEQGAGGTNPSLDEAAIQRALARVPTPDSHVRVLRNLVTRLANKTAPEARSASSTIDSYEAGVAGLWHAKRAVASLAVASGETRHSYLSPPDWVHRLIKSQ